MNTIKKLHALSSIFFFILVLSYVGMTLSFRNELWPEFFLNLMRVLDIPLAFVSLLYGGTTLALQINTHRHHERLSAWTMVIFFVCLLLFTAVLIANFAFPSAI